MGNVVDFPEERQREPDDPQPEMDHSEDEDYDLRRWDEVERYHEEQTWPWWKTIGVGLVIGALSAIPVINVLVWLILGAYVITWISKVLLHSIGLLQGVERNTRR